MAKCYAPVFSAAPGLVCFFLAIVFAITIVALAPFAVLPPIACLIKKISFRISYCTKGNSNPRIEL